MSASDKFLYCSQCGSKLMKTCKFVQNAEPKLSREKVQSASTKSFNVMKSNERAGFFKRKERERTRDENARSKKSTWKFSFLARERVAINIGLVESTNKNDYNLGPVRGSHLPVKVQKTFTAAEVLSAGILKHSNYNQFFCSSENHLLLYPEQKVITNVLRSEELFTVERSKKELAKP